MKADSMPSSLDGVIKALHSTLVSDRQTKARIMSMMYATTQGADSWFATCTASHELLHIQQVTSTSTPWVAPVLDAMQCRSISFIVLQQIHSA